ncbi:hypothetical protein L1049_001733 [Liquidambar formosana]|uniref:Uncharacterized protein n=1 Tax=Liquidambar formosana TaxID=63359 RepID=A0AAP0N170_LIQFO
MEMVESCVQDEDGRVSIPRGGPIYLPNLVGPLTRVADFKASLRQHLQDLEAEICLDSSQACGEDISVDELKIFTEEELVSKAFEEAFKDSVEADKSSPIAEEHSNAGRKDNCKISSNKCVYLKLFRKRKGPFSFI